MISGNPQKVVNSKGSAGAKPVIQGRPEAEPEKIRKTAENIRQMLDERKALRRQLDETAGRNRSVRQTIFVRSQFLNSANDSVSNWLERVENSLL